MAKQEGIDLLLDVIRYFLRKKQRKDFHFTCIGTGPALNYFRKLSEDRNLSDYINFTGFIPDNELLEILSSSDVCVNPDIPCDFNDKSTMIKIMEYMALGKPIVQFDHKEGRFSAQEASLYAQNGSAEDFGEKILKLFDNEDLRIKMGDFGYRRVKDRLEWKYSIPNLLRAYDTLFQ
jgi:glycosyltransferase involved in cell wall biosynthesis